MVFKNFAPGTTIRSFDFGFTDAEGNRTNVGYDMTGPAACFREGVVDTVEYSVDDGVTYYYVRTTRIVIGGNEVNITNWNCRFRCPINGTPSLMGPLNNVEKVA